MHMCSRMHSQSSLQEGRVKSRWVVFSVDRHGMYGQQSTRIMTFMGHTKQFKALWYWNWFLVDSEDRFSYESLWCPNLQTWLFSCYCRCQMPYNPITLSLPLAHVHKYIGSTTVIVLHVSPFEPEQSISCRVLCLGSTLCYFTIDNIFQCLETVWSTVKLLLEFL